MTPNQQLHDEWSAWCEMAMLCEGPVNGGELVVPWSTGLCGLKRICKIDGLQFRVNDRLWANRPNQRSFWWPHTRSGWNARSRFCWRMAQQCEREMNEPQPQEQAR